MALVETRSAAWLALNTRLGSTLRKFLFLCFILRGFLLLSTLMSCALPPLNCSMPLYPPMLFEADPDIAGIGVGSPS